MADLLGPNGTPAATAEKNSELPQLSVKFKNSVLNNLPVGIELKIGDGPEFTLNPDQLDNLGVNFIRQAMQIRMAAANYTEQVAQRTMAGVDPSKLRA